MQANRLPSGPSAKNVRCASNVASCGWGIKASVLQTEDGDWQEFLGYWGIKLFYVPCMKIQQYIVICE